MRFWIYGPLHVKTNVMGYTLLPRWSFWLFFLRAGVVTISVAVQAEGTDEKKNRFDFQKMRSFLFDFPFFGIAKTPMKNVMKTVVKTGVKIA